MKITPLDIKKQEFKKVFRGFDPVEVETFLEMISEEFEALIKERNNLADDVLKLKTQLSDYQEVEKTFKNSLMSAQQTINQSRENSQKEANLIIKEAELKAEKILEDAKLKLIEMKNELMLVRSQKDSFAKRLRHLLESQLEMIGVLEINDLGLGSLEKSPNRDKKVAPKIISSEKNKKEILDTNEKKNENTNAKNQIERKSKKFSDQFII